MNNLDNEYNMCVLTRNCGITPKDWRWNDFNLTSESINCKWPAPKEDKNTTILIRTEKKVGELEKYIPEFEKTLLAKKDKFTKASEEAKAALSGFESSFYLTLNDWKVVAKNIMPLATKDEIKAYFDQFKNTDTSDVNADDLLTFREFTKALENLREKND